MLFTLLLSNLLLQKWNYIYSCILDVAITCFYIMESPVDIEYTKMFLPSRSPLTHITTFLIDLHDFYIFCIISKHFWSNTLQNIQAVDYIHNYQAWIQWVWLIFELALMVQKFF